MHLDHMLGLKDEDIGGGEDGNGDTDDQHNLVQEFLLAQCVAILKEREEQMKKEQEKVK